MITLNERYLPWNKLAAIAKLGGVCSKHFNALLVPYGITEQNTAKEAFAGLARTMGVMQDRKDEHHPRKDAEGRNCEGTLMDKYTEVLGRKDSVSGCGKEDLKKALKPGGYAACLDRCKKTCPCTIHHVGASGY